MFMNKTKSMMTGVLAAMTVVAMAQPWHSNGYKINSYWFADCPGSTFTSTSTGVDNLILHDENVVNSDTTKFANRHLASISTDGGATAYGSSDPKDETFQIICDMMLESQGPAGAFPRTVEGGFFMRIPAVGGWISENQQILTNDGEMAAFGFPIPFHNFGGDTYTLGSVKKMGCRYMKSPTDGQYYWQWMRNGTWSIPLLLDVLTEHDFGLEGLWSYTFEGTERKPHFGFYLQVPNPLHPAVNSGFASHFGKLTMSNISVDPFPAVKNMVTLEGPVMPYAKSKTVTVETRNPGSLTALNTYTVKLTDKGKMAFKPMEAPGTYDVAIKGAKHLRKVVKNVQIKDDDVVTIGNVTLLTGDANNDNVISTDDYLILNSSFDTAEGDAGYDARADFDDNDTIGTDDYLFLNSNFDLSGDE